MTDRTEDSIQLDHTRRTFLGAGALALLGLAAPTVRPAAAQTPKRGGTLVVAADVSPPGLDRDRRLAPRRGRRLEIPGSAGIPRPVGGDDDVARRQSLHVLGDRRGHSHLVVERVDRVRSARDARGADGAGDGAGEG